MIDESKIRKFTWSNNWCPGPGYLAHYYHSSRPSKCCNTPDTVFNENSTPKLVPKKT